MERYERIMKELFTRHPSFQAVGKEAYHPGLEGIQVMDGLMGHPHRSYKCIHVAGTNGKGSVCHMMAAALAAQGHKVGLYTSPHLLDFRERIRVISLEGGSSAGAVPSGSASFRLIDKEMYWHMNKDDNSFIIDRGISLHKLIRFITIVLGAGFTVKAEGGVLEVASTFSLYSMMTYTIIST